MLELHEVTDDGRDVWQPVLAERQARLRFLGEYDDADTARAKGMEMEARLRDDSRLFELVTAGAAVGHLWWGRDGEDASVIDVRLDDPAGVHELLPALFDLARTDGRPRIGVGGTPGDPTRMALIGLAGFRPLATNMLLRADAPVADPGDLALRPMAEEEYDAFYAELVSGYADELHATGMSREAADERSRTQSEEFLKDGLASRHHAFFTGVVREEPVGTLWVSTERPMAFVYDVVVREDQRRRGYGAALMNAGALWSREQGHFAIGLNVFAHNPNARALYDKLGYQVTVDYRAVDVPDAG